MESNTGFDEPALWMDYAQRHGFKPVKAVKVPRCPNCSAAPRRPVWGQYVYYSTLIHLLECEHCSLVWADAHIDPEIIRRHFEGAYKGDAYFRESRNAVFEHLVAVIDSLAPRSARILDIGGARGDLMATVAARRPDVRPAVHDLSKTATDWASEHFGLATLTGDANTLAAHSEQYDVVVLSDVLYYEPNLKVLWSALSRLIRPGGSIVIRVPNRVPFIRLGQIWFHLTHTGVRRILQDNVPFYNPEHIFVFRRPFLRDWLKSIGLKRVDFVPAPLLTSAKWSAAQSAVFKLASIVSYFSRHTLVLTPSMLVIGTGRSPNGVGVDV